MSVKTFLPGKSGSIALALLLVSGVPARTLAAEPDFSTPHQTINLRQHSSESFTFLSSLSLASGKEQNRPEIFNQALEFSEQGKHKQALALIKPYRKQYPDSVSAELLYGVLLYNQGEPQQAEKVFRALTQDNSPSPESFNNLAVIYAERGDYPKAIDTLQQAFNAHSSYEKIYSNIKTIYATMASEAYNKALDLNKEQADSPKLAVLETPSAIQWLDTAIKPAPIDQVVTTQTAIDSINKDIESHLKSWARAWSGQSLSGYISAYTRNYRPNSKLDHQQWINQRKKRLSKPGFIEVNLSNFKIQVFNNDLAEAIFTQRYRSDSYQDAVRKRAVLVKTEKGWKISQEQSLAVID